MNKLLEALERLAMPDELHIKECEKLGIGLTDDYELVKESLLELIAIKESKPSEAMKCLKNFVENNEKGTYSIRDKKYIDIIIQALLKEEECTKRFIEEAPRYVKEITDYLIGKGDKENG